MKEVQAVFPPVRKTGGILLAGLVLGAALVPGLAEADPLKLTYTGYLASMPILDMTTAINTPAASNGAGIGDGPYRIDAAIDTTGNFDMLSPFHATLSGQGAISAAQAKPSQFQMNAKTRQRQETITITYDKDGKATIVADPTPKPSRLAARQADAANSMDPASAVVALTALMNQQQGCGGPYPVFDGTRRYNVTMQSLGRETLAPMAQSAYQGPALKCQATLVPAGNPDGKDAKISKMHTDSALFWLAPAAGKKMSIPVRISAHNSYGEMILDLVKVE